MEPPPARWRVLTIGGVLVAALAVGCRPDEARRAEKPPPPTSRASQAEPHSTGSLGTGAGRSKQAAMGEEPPRRGSGAPSNLPAESEIEPVSKHSAAAGRPASPPAPSQVVVERPELEDHHQPANGRPRPPDTETAEARPEGATLRNHDASVEHDASVAREVEAKPEFSVPLVDDPASLQQLHPYYPVWIDRQRRHVVMVGEICQRYAPLELFACMRISKEYESVVVVDTKAYVLHAGLLAVGAEPGAPVQFMPEFIPPSGTRIEVTAVWKDKRGHVRRVRGQDWVHDVSGVYAMFRGVTPNEFDEELNVGDQWAAWKSMEYPWVFAGSGFYKDENTGEQYYLADMDGDLICVSNFPSAVLDVPIRSSESNEALLFSAFTERIPPLGTPVTLILTPQPDRQDAPAGREASGRASPPPSDQPSARSDPIHGVQTPSNRMNAITTNISPHEGD